MELISEIKKLKRETQTSVRKLLSLQRDLPEGLKPILVEGAVAGKMAVPDTHLEYTLEKYRQRIDQTYRVPYTTEMHKALDGEIKRTGVGFTTFMSFANQIPEGLTSSQFHMIRGRKTQTVRLNHYEYIMALYKKIPDDQTPTYVGANEDEAERFTLSTADRQAISNIVKLTPIAVTKILHFADDKPHGIRAAMISGWINGSTKTARVDYYEWVLNEFTKYPKISKDKIV